MAQRAWPRSQREPARSRSRRARQAEAFFTEVDAVHGKIGDSAEQQIEDFVLMRHLEGDRAAPTTTVAEVGRPSPGQSWQIARQMGLGAMVRLLGSPVLGMSVVNTRRPTDDFNHVCQTYTTSERQSLRLAGAQDKVVIAHPVYRRLEFKAEFVQQLDGVGFVFLRPEPLT